RACLQLREQVADMGRDGLLAEEEPLPDLPVHEAVRDQLKDLDLPHRRLLLELLERAVERDDLAVAVPAARGRNRLETAAVVHIPGQDFFALGCVHEPAIGRGKDHLEAFLPRTRGYLASLTAAGRAGGSARARARRASRQE